MDQNPVLLNIFLKVQCPAAARWVSAALEWDAFAGYNESRRLRNLIAPSIHFYSDCSIVLAGCFLVPWFRNEVRKIRVCAAFAWGDLRDLKLYQLVSLNYLVQSSMGRWILWDVGCLFCSFTDVLGLSLFHNICLNFLLLLLCCISLWSKKTNENNSFSSVASVCCASHTSLFQSHHGGLLYQVPLYEAPEILAVHAEVWQLECVDGHLERELLVGTLAGHLEPRQGDDSRAGVGDPAGETLLWKDQ